MKRKNKLQPQKDRKISPEEAVAFLDSIRVMSQDIDEPTTLISIRVPANILRSLKLKARSEGKKYQSLMVDYCRKGLRS